MTLKGIFPVLVVVVKDQGPLGGNLTVCLAAVMEGSQVANLNLGYQRRRTPSCIADSPLSTHVGRIPSGRVHLPPSQPPWQDVAGHWSGCRTPFMCTIVTTVVTWFGHETAINSSSRRACKFCGAEGLPVQSCKPSVLITWRLGRRFSCCRRWYCRGRLRGRSSSREAL